LYKLELASLAIIAPEAVFLVAIQTYFYTREQLDEFPASILEVRIIYLFSIANS
jgi:hypothetical protein